MKLNDWQLYAFASAFFASMTAVFAKVGISASSMNSNLATFIRTIVVILFSASILTWRREWKGPDDWDSKTVLFLILSGLATGASWLCYYRALQLGPASKVAPVDKLSVALTILIAIVFLGERATIATVVGGSLIVIGSLVIALS